MKAHTKINRYLFEIFRDPMLCYHSVKHPEIQCNGFSLTSKQKQVVAKKKCLAAARFPSISTSEINNLAEKSRNASTNKSTRFWVNVFQTWAKVRNKEEDLEKYEYARLDLTLCRYVSFLETVSELCS